MDSVPRDIVNAALRVNLPFFGIACITLIVGVSSLLLARLRFRDRLLLWVGIFSVLYAMRLFVTNELVRDAFNAPGREYVPWDLSITYLINIPFALFARELLGRGWKASIFVWLWLDVAFAIVAIPAALLAHQIYWTDLINKLLVVSGTMLILLHVFIRRKGADPFAASLAWPLLVFGILVLLENKGFQPAGINMEPIGFLILLGGLASTAIRRALTTERKLIDMEQELATARRIQNSIIPPAPPSFPPLRLATRYQPMSAVAGDFYDFLNTGQHLLTILVADVSGHGVPAALVASMLKICFNAQQQQANNPAGILAALNVMLHGSLGGQYVTAACAAIDTEARVITYAGAGHPPALFLQSDPAEIIHLAENGLFIGPFPNATYANMSVPFRAGDKLLLYTDGIIEATGPDGQEFGREGLEHFFLNSPSREPGEFLDGLFQEISTGVQQDDLTAVLTHLG